MEPLQHTTQRIERCLLAVAGGRDRTIARNELLACAVRRIREIVRRELRQHPEVGRWEQEDDLVQEVLIRVDRAVQDAKPEFVGQFFIIAAQHARWATVDLIRRHFGPMGRASRHQTGEERVHAAPERAGEGGGAPSIDSLRIHEAVDSLDEELREAWLLRTYAGLTHEAIAELLGISSRTVHRRLTEAKLRLADLLIDRD